MLSYFLLEVGVVVKYQLVESGYALFGERNEEYFLMQGNFERKNAIIIGSIIKQVTNEGGQFLLENNGVVYLMQMKHKILSYFVRRIFDNKPA